MFGPGVSKILQLLTRVDCATVSEDLQKISGDTDALSEAEIELGHAILLSQDKNLPWVCTESELLDAVEVSSEAVDAMTCDFFDICDDSENAAYTSDDLFRMSQALREKYLIEHYGPAMLHLAQLAEDAGCDSDVRVNMDSDNVPNIQISSKTLLAMDESGQLFLIPGQTTQVPFPDLTRKALLATGLATGACDSLEMLTDPRFQSNLIVDDEGHLVAENYLVTSEKIIPQPSIHIPDEAFLGIFMGLCGAEVVCGEESEAAPEQVPYTPPQEPNMSDPDHTSDSSENEGNVVPPTLQHDILFGPRISL